MNCAFLRRTRRHEPTLTAERWFLSVYYSKAESAVKGVHPGLADQLELVRGGEDALIAAIGELLGTKETS
jgi:hypothetical protein